jgi:hypothetical protein
MFRWFQALPLALALASLCTFAASCGSTSQSQVRLVHAISDGPALDVDINTTKVFSNIAFTGIQPAPPAYNKVNAGSVTLEAVNTGTSTAVIANTNASLSGSSQYTVVMAGFLNGQGATAPTFYLITDNNAAPTSGNVAFRIINASSNSPVGGFDVYIVPPGTNITGLTPQVSGLTLGQGSTYTSLNFDANGYQVIATPHGNQGGSDVNQIYPTPTGSIRTLVIVDNQGGGGISQFPLELNDLN